MSISNARLITKAIQRFAPVELADRSWDNVGLLLESPFEKSSSNNVVITNDLTEKVFNSIVENHPNTSVIISYHPPIFKPLKCLTLDEPIQRTLLKCVGAGISVYSPHTSLDAAKDGINDFLLNAAVGVKVPSSPIIPSNDKNEGMGRYVSLDYPQQIGNFINNVKNNLNLKHIQFADGGKHNINSIAVCAGSGSSILRSAPKVDLWVTGEMGHHDVLAAVAKGISVILTNHSNSERMYLQSDFKNSLQKAIIDEINERSENVNKEFTLNVIDVDQDPLITV